jgi:TolB-like protein
MSLPPDESSIALLPFVNMSEDPERQYFCDGITEDLISDLSKISGLLVIARNSVFIYKGRAVKKAIDKLSPEEKQQLLSDVLEKFREEVFKNPG